MAHGSPSIRICYNCNMYGLISRFSPKICPNCNKEVNTISLNNLRSLLNKGILDEIPLSFNWKKIN